jgi:transposase InsO family protein
MWIAVKPATSITTARVVEFVKEIMYMFGVPNNIITNNGTLFTAREFKDFCADSGIKSNMLRCHTHRVMVKWSAQTA